MYTLHMIVYYLGVIKTFNFDGGVHLADQNQNICMRRERGTCKVCYSMTGLFYVFVFNSHLTTKKNLNIVC